MTGTEEAPSLDGRRGSALFGWGQRKCPLWEKEMSCAKELYRPRKMTTKQGEMPWRLQWEYG